MLFMIPLLSEQSINQAFPWVKPFRSILKEAQPKPFPGTHLMIGSDYSGDHSRSNYRVYAFLLADADMSPSYPDARRRMRNAYLSDGRRMSYKALNDGIRRKSLLPFLRTSEELHGLCTVIIVHKDLRHMTTTKKTLDIWQDLIGLRGRWSPKAFETMARIAHFYCLLVSSCSSRHQHQTWISDQDEIVANDDRHTDIMNLVAKMIALYAKVPYGEFAMNTTAVDTAERAFEDFVAVPDLLAGAFADTVTEWSRTPDWGLGKDLTLHSTAIPSKANEIITWYTSDSKELKRCAILIDRVQDDLFSVQEFDIYKKVCPLSLS